MDDQNVRGRTNRGTLNVLLHGTFLFDHSEEGEVTAYIPGFKDEVVRAGNWLAETTLRSGEHRLNVVGAQTAEQRKTPRPNPEHNLIFYRRLKAQEPSETGPLYATIALGKPLRITSLRRAAIPSEAFVVPGTNEPSADLPADYRGRMSTSHVLSYDFDDDAEVFLTNHSWEPMLQRIGETSVINLHVLSSHETDRGHEHVSEAFAHLVALLEVDIQMRTERPPVPDDLDAELPDGIIAEEAEDLPRRNRRLARLARMRKDDRDLNQLWFKAEGLNSGDPTNCPSCWNCPPPPPPPPGPEN